MAHASRPVVVGVDGSEASLAALDWAVGEALARDQYLRIVHAHIWPLLRPPSGPPPFEPADASLRADAERMLDAAVLRALGQAPALRVERPLRDGFPSAVLLAEARQAELMVLGALGVGGFPGLLAGSVSSQVAAHAPCPVVVVRPRRHVEAAEEATRDRVVVGVDGGISALAALGFAFEEAERLGAGLTAIHCTSALVAPTPGEGGLADNRQVMAERQMLAEAIGPWADKHPEVDVRQLLMTGRPASTLVAASRGAWLLVLGARGLGGFSGLRLGSVSQQLLHHAECPVALVRRDR